VIEPLLRAEDLTYAVDGRTIIDGVSLAIERSERVAVMGPSGSGKSTLFTLLAGLATPASGRVLLRGEPVGEPNRQDISYVFQGYGLVSLLTATENIEVALRAAGRPPEHARRLAADALDMVGLTPFADHLIEELSGGQQQRTAVALALARRPGLLLADEPTAEQDSGNRDLVLKSLLAETERGAALVIATHDPDVAARCDRVLTLRAGRLAPPDEAPDARPD